MKKDILKKIEKDFSCPEEALKLLSEMLDRDDEVTSDRTYRSVIYLSNGNIESLKHFIELYFLDYRDLFWQAEYETPEKQKYNFNKSFNKLGLL